MDTANTPQNKKHEDDRRNDQVKLQNPNIEKMNEDVLYHFALGTNTHDFKLMFGDIKFVVVGGSPRRMHTFAQFMLKSLEYRLPAGQDLVNIARATDRYAMYKVGPVLSISHGMGIPSVSIMLHEVIKLLFHAEATNVTFFRIGTSGGLGLEPGSVVISEAALDAQFQPHLDLTILGKVVSRPSVLDQELAKELVGCAKPDDAFATILGKTMCTTDFYEGQGRLDGAFCDYTEEQKMAFLKKAYDNGIRNIEMESLCFAAMCYHAKIKGAVACVAILDRFKGDQISTPSEVLKQWDNRPAELVSRFIRKRLGLEE